MQPLDTDKTCMKGEIISRQVHTDQLRRMEQLGTDTSDKKTKERAESILITYTRSGGVWSKWRYHDIRPTGRWKGRREITDGAFSYGGCSNKFEG